ncbi:hypothetical protein VSR68_05105 [Paraburkholderia phymatum]|uniref:hypothetical protein n=1 Tax=Paraburkholderia phymatum TaxID=148447 RepID=UPI00317C332A
MSRHSTKKESSRFENKTRSNVGAGIADAGRLTSPLAFVAPLPHRPIADAFIVFSILRTRNRPISPLPSQRASRKRRMVYRLLIHICETHEDTGSPV